MPRLAHILAAFALLGSASCALLGKSEALAPRYFSPDSAPRRTSSSSPEPAAQLELNLGRISSASYLGERIVYRDSNYELNFYQERRWSERPEAYLRRALSRALFEERGLHRVVSGSGPTLDVELSEFAEIRAESPVARVSATFILSDRRLVRREATVTIELPIQSTKPLEDAPEAAVRAMTDALNRTVDQIVEQVLASLRAGPTPIDPDPAAAGAAATR